MNTWKRVAAAFLAVCMLMSLMVFPSATAVTQLEETITLGFGESAWDDSGVCTVPITATGAGDSFGVRNIELLVKFDKDILQLDKVSGHIPNVVKVIEEDGEEEEVKYRMSPSAITTKLDADKYGDMSLQDMINQNGCVYLLLVDTSTEHSDDHIVTSGFAIVDLKFKAQTGAEGKSSTLSFASVDAPYYEGKEIIIGTAAEGVYHINVDATTTVTVPNGETVTVTYKANGGAGNDVTETVNKDAAVTLKPADTFAAPTGKQFKAWDVNGEEKAPGESVAVSADTEIKAVWKDPDPVTVTVTYKANGGAGDDVTETVNKDAAVTLKPADTFVAPTGKQFKAWDVNGAEVQPGAQIEITADTTIKAIWDDIPVNPGGSSSSDGGCYVATAVYGSYDCPQVWTLRRFRDNVLAQTWYGRLFIKAYYAVSPTCVKLFGDTEIFQNFFRNILDPWVAELQEDGFESTPYNDIDW